jgi:transposase
MSLPQFDVQGSLFESLGSIAPARFGDQDKYQLFAKKVWPVLARCREQLAEGYTTDNGRPGVEPVVWLGVLIFQCLERVPDRQAAERIKYRLGWKLALNLKLGDPGFHPTTLVYFRQRLLEHAKSDLAFRAVLEALQAEGLLPKRGKQRLDSTHVLAAVAALSALGCVRETLRLALEELGQALPEKARPGFWPVRWERYVENKLDYRSRPGRMAGRCGSGWRRRAPSCATAGRWNCCGKCSTSNSSSRRISPNRSKSMRRAWSRAPMTPTRKGRPRAGANTARVGWVTRCRSPRPYRRIVRPPLWCRRSGPKRFGTAQRTLCRRRLPLGAPAPQGGRGRLDLNGPRPGQSATAGAGSPAKLKISASALPTDALTALPATKADVAAASARPAKPKSPTVLSGARATANAARCEISAFRPTKTIAR